MTGTSCASFHSVADLSMSNETARLTSLFGGKIKDCAMSKKLAPARTVARPRNNNGFWLDHAKIVEEDFAWLASVERLILWNVQVPSGFLARLNKLWWLDIRGGSASDLNVARGATKLQYLAVNQVRGMRDLSAISEMLSLRYVDFYGLTRVATLPSFAAHEELKHASVGQMQGLQSLRGLLQAPKLEELQLNKKINVNAEDVAQIANHPTIKQFGWFAEDVPYKVWAPVIEKIGLPPVPHDFPEDWFRLSDSSM